MKQVNFVKLSCPILVLLILFSYSILRIQRYRLQAEWNNNRDLSFNDGYKGTFFRRKFFDIESNPEPPKFSVDLINNLTSNNNQAGTIYDYRDIPEESHAIFLNDNVTVDINYAGVRLENFDSDKENDEQRRPPSHFDRAKENPVFQRFSSLMINRHQFNLKERAASKDSEKDLRAFSKYMMNKFTGSESFFAVFPNIRVNSIYILHYDNKNSDKWYEETGFLIKYPIAIDPRGNSRNYREREWFKSANGDRESTWIQVNESSGISKIYSDTHSESTDQPLKVRTIWHKFSDEDGREYILCFDLFLVSKNLTFFDEIYSIQYGIEPIFWLLMPIVAFGLAFLILKRGTSVGSDVLKNIVGQRDQKKTVVFRSSSDYGVLKTTVTAENKESLEFSEEIGWSHELFNINVSAEMRQSRREEAKHNIEFTYTKRYNLSFANGCPPYQCIETWNILIPGRSGHLVKIGAFVAETFTSKKLKPDIVLHSIYWRKEYSQYLEKIKMQLENQLLKDDQETISLNLDTPLPSVIPSMIRETNEVESILEKHSSMQHGRFVFSDLRVLKAFWQKSNEVQGIYSLSLLQEIIEDNQSVDLYSDFAQGQKDGERYILEYQSNQFREFYQNLSTELQNQIVQQSAFQIVVYDESVTHLIKPHEDFSLLTSKGKSFVIYIYADDRNGSASKWWISWRKSDVKYYNELFAAQYDRSHKIKNIASYLGLS